MSQLCDAIDVLPHEQDSDDNGCCDIAVVSELGMKGASLGRSCTVPSHHAFGPH